MPHSKNQWSTWVKRLPQNRLENHDFPHESISDIPIWSHLATSSICRYDNTKYSREFQPVILGNCSILHVQFLEKMTPEISETPWWIRCCFFLDIFSWQIHQKSRCLCHAPPPLSRTSQAPFSPEKTKLGRLRPWIMDHHGSSKCHVDDVVSSCLLDIKITFSGKIMCRKNKIKTSPV